MKRSSLIYSTAILVSIFALYTGVYGQDGAASEKKDEKSSEKLVGTYLDIAMAKERATVMEARIKNDIYKFQVVVANFGDESDKSALKDIVAQHVHGKKELFKRQYLSADKIFQELHKKVGDLFTGLSDKYEKRANEILSRCAETLVDKEIGIGSTRDAILSDNAARTSRKISENKIRLLIAYDHLNMGDDFKFENRLSDAITHYRLAKLHGVNILVDLADTEDEKNKIRSEFKADLADGENLVSK